MSLKIERGSYKNGIQIVRTVVDTLRACTCACKYCYFFHKDFGGAGDFLPAKIIESILRAADKQSQLDVVLSGGEITIHPEWEQILEATHVLKKTGTTLITNGTILDKKRVGQIRKSNISRVCLSLDGATAEIHNYGRGNTFSKALRGLYELQASGKNITVLTVVHQGNIDHLLELSEFLAKNKLAKQHHFACLYHSGRARANWKELIVPLKKVKLFQKKFDTVFDDLRERGLFLLFNHYWPLTGLRKKSGNHRELLSHQLGEQNKSTWAVVRCNGDVNATIAYWGRESAQNANIGNLFKESAEVLFTRLDKLYRSGKCRQLPREVEAKHKFIVDGVFDKKMADVLIGDEEKNKKVKLMRCVPMSKMDIMQKPLKPKYIGQMANQYLEAPDNYRFVQHATGVFLFYNNTTAHAIMLNKSELSKLEAEIKSRKKGQIKA